MYRRRLSPKAQTLLALRSELEASVLQSVHLLPALREVCRIEQATWGVAG